MITHKKGYDKKRAFAQRLAKVCDDKGIPERGRDATLGRMFHKDPKAALKWRLGENMPDWETLMEMMDRWNLNANYFLCGFGPRYRVTLTEQHLYICGIYDNLIQEYQEAWISEGEKFLALQRARADSLLTHKGRKNLLSD